MPSPRSLTRHTGFLRIFLVFVLQATSVLPIALAADPGDLVLFEAGKTHYQIVIPDTFPSPSIEAGLRQTARLMQVAFRIGEESAMPIVTESQRDEATPAIFLGDTAFARGESIDVTRLSGWGYIHRVVGQNLVIVGRDQPAPVQSTNTRRPAWDRFGTAKGVVDFLRQYVGTRFLYPDLPPTTPISSAAKLDLIQSPAFDFSPPARIVVPRGLNLTKIPSLEYNTSYPARGSFYDIANNAFPPVDVVFGGHTYERAIPRERYAPSHPEYFALINGQRTANETGNAQYCISNPQVQELFFQDLVGLIDRGYAGVDLGQPDGFRACQCEACTKLFDTGNDWGEKLWILHKQIAERVEQVRPGKRVTMMSYILTALPPKSFRTFPSNTRILLTGTNEEDIAPWREHQVPAGFASYVYNWCPNLGSRYTPMRTPRFVESQARRLIQNQFQSIYRDGAGCLFGLEGPVYYTMGRMFDDPENLLAKDLVQEFCTAAFGKGAPPMVAFYNQLYHGIELYSEHLGTRSPAWTYQNIYGQRRKYLSDPFQFLGFLYTPSLLSSLETNLVLAEQGANDKKVRARLAMVRREFDYLQALVKVVHLYHAFQIQPDFASRDRLLTAINARNTFIDSLFEGPRGSAKPLTGWTFVTFPPLGHDAKHLRLAYDGYQEPYANTPVNWDTQAMRLAPLPGAKRLSVPLIAQSVTLTSDQWQRAESAHLNLMLSSVDRSNPQPASMAKVQALADEDQLHLLIQSALSTVGQQDAIDIYLAPQGEKEITYRLSVRPDPASKQDAAAGFHNDPLDPRYGHFDPDWNGDWHYESRVDPGEQRWIAHIAIPFKTLGVERPTAGSFWRGNVGRTRIVAPDRIERTLWSSTPSTKVMDDRNDFGEFVFVADEGPAKGPGQMSSNEPILKKNAIDPTLARMRELEQQRQWATFLKEFGELDISGWPGDAAIEAGEAFRLRGQAYSILKDGPRAEADLQAAIQRTPNDARLWLTLGDNYVNNLKNDTEALAAYRQALTISGPGNGWQSLSATLAIARLLTDQTKTDQALAVMHPYGDLQGMAPVWRIKMLRALGHIYASQGKEQESLAKFREALNMESQP